MFHIGQVQVTTVKPTYIRNLEDDSYRRMNCDGYIPSEKVVSLDFMNTISVVTVTDTQGINFGRL